MKDNPFYTIAFMLIVSAVFALMLSLTNEIYLPRIEANELLEDRRAVLYVFELDTEGEAEEVLDRFESHVEEQTIADIQLYVHLEGDEVLAYAVPFTGSGLWGTMNGYLGISPDITQVTGLIFTEHNETPGLGGRIDELDYLEQFRGIDIREETTLAYGSDGGDQLDAITGATGTSNAVLNILNDLLDETISELEVALNG